MADPSGKIIIYQLMTRLFGNKVTSCKRHGTIEENGVGKFNDINAQALEGIRELGVTHVWYTGVVEHATLTDYTAYGIAADDADVVKGRAGSPYAIKDYYDVDPDLAVSVPARMREFEDLAARTHAHGLKVVIDFVPNHVARAYRSDARPRDVKDLGEDDDPSLAFHPSNNFYYLPGQSFQPPVNPSNDFFHPSRDGRFDEFPSKATGNDEFTATPGVHSWYETVKLNYGVDVLNGRTKHFDLLPDTWRKMRDILVFWTKKQIDGFRCDMAEMVPVEFWAWVIPQIKAINPDMLFIAEIYDHTRYRTYVSDAKFDVLYDKVLLYDTLRALLAGRGSTESIATIRNDLQGISHRMLHFLENHDEQRVASVFVAGSPWHALPAVVISATIDRGPFMIYFGQEVGEPAHGAKGFQGDDGRTTLFDYWCVPEHQKWMNGGRFDGGQLSDEQKRLRTFYSRLLTFTAQSSAIAHGVYADLTHYNVAKGNFSRDVHAFVRYYGEERLLIVNSFNETEIDVTIQIPGETFMEMGLTNADGAVVRDMLWQEVESGFDRDLSLRLKLAPFSCFVFEVRGQG